MKHVLVKKSHQAHLMDGKEYESKSVLRHDLMHFSYVKITGSQEGSFAQRSNSEREEMIIGVLQGGAKLQDEGSITDLTKIISSINEMLKANNHERIILSADEIQSVYNEYFYLLKKWNALKAGESMEVII